MKNDKNNPLEWPKVLLTGVDDIDLSSWEDARHTDSEALSWVRFESEEMRKNGSIDVTVRVDPVRFAEITDGLRGRRQIVDAVRWTIDAIAHEVNEADYIHGELEGLPLRAGSPAPREYALMLEWTPSEAYEVMGLIAASRGDVSGIVLQRCGPVGKTAVSVAVFLPPAIFDAAWRKRLDAKSTTKVARCVFDAIYESYVAEPRPSVGLDLDEIPF